jgi:triphosphoribosyl-dephospho-CoA synthase
MGKSEQQDLGTRPTLPFREIMSLAASWDNLARQYQNGFAEIFEIGVPALLECYEKNGSLEKAIQYCQLQLMANLPDSLIARKLGKQEALQASAMAREMIQMGFPNNTQAVNRYQQWDAYLREKGNQRNPGSTADLITACLYVALRSYRIDKSAVL